MQCSDTLRGHRVELVLEAVELRCQGSTMRLEVDPQRFCLQLLTLCHGSCILQHT